MNIDETLTPAHDICNLSLTQKNICNLIGWEEYNIGHICTLFSIFLIFD